MTHSTARHAALIRMRGRPLGGTLRYSARYGIGEGDTDASDIVADDESAGWGAWLSDQGAMAAAYAEQAARAAGAVPGKVVQAGRDAFTDTVSAGIKAGVDIGVDTGVAADEAAGWFPTLPSGDDFTDMARTAALYTGAAALGLGAILATVYVGGRVLR